MIYYFQEAVEFCKTHGVPVMFKAAYGGGGRGMRAVMKMEDVAEQFERARQVAFTKYASHSNKTLLLAEAVRFKLLEKFGKGPLKS